MKKVILLGLALAAAPALAWEPEVHVSLVQAALRISPAAEARLPAEFRDALFSEVSGPDFLDKDCRNHGSLAGERDAAVQAERLLADLTNPKKLERPYPRAQAIGRYLHYVADSVVPAELRVANAPRLPNLFANQNFVLFRERRPLAAPLAESLRTRGAEAAWATSEEPSHQSLMRLVANTMADALELLPARAGAEKAPGDGPVLFVVNRLDNGTAGNNSGWSRTKTSTYMTDISSHPFSEGPTSGGWIVEEWTFHSSSRGASSRKLNLMEKLGVQIAEVTLRTGGGKGMARILLFNNSDLCAVDVGMRAGAWRWDLKQTMPPRSLKLVELDVPADFASRRLVSGYHADSCDVKPGSQGFILSDRRVIIGNPGTAPRFDREAEVNLASKR